MNSTHKMQDSRAKGSPLRSPKQTEFGFRLAQRVCCPAPFGLKLYCAWCRRHAVLLTAPRSLYVHYVATGALASDMQLAQGIPVSFLTKRQDSSIEVYWTIPKTLHRLYCYGPVLVVAQWHGRVARYVFSVSLRP